MIVNMLTSKIVINLIHRHVEVKIEELKHYHAMCRSARAATCIGNDVILSERILVVKHRLVLMT